METSKPLITVVVPVKNRAEIVTDTLDSIAAQTFRPLKLIVVDNASYDDTLKRVSGWTARDHGAGFLAEVISEKKPGAAAARNAGLALADTPYVMFFDSDDRMLPGHVARVADGIARHPDARILYWDIAIIDSDGWLTVKRPHKGNLLDSHLLHGTLSTQRMAVVTDYIRSVGGWKDSIRQWDDLELGMRLLLGIADNPSGTCYLTGSPTVEVYPREDSLTGPDYSSVADNLMRTLDEIDTDIDCYAATENSDRDTVVRLRALVSLRRADIAGHLAREGRREEAGNIMREILADTPLAEALRLRAAYTAVRLLGRGGFLTYMSLLSPKVSKHRLDAPKALPGD